MDSLFSPELGLSIWTLVTFALLVLLLGRYAWKPFLKVLEDREKTIRNAVEESQRTRQAAEEIKKQLEAEWASAQGKVQSMLDDAKEDAGKLRDQLMREAEKDAKGLIEQGRLQLAAEKDQLAAQLRQHVSELTVELTEKVLRNPRVMHERTELVETLLNDLEKEKARPS